MRPRQFPYRLRPTIVGLLMFAMLTQMGWSDVPCCCHDRHDAVLVSVDRSVDRKDARVECVEAGNSNVSCEDSCCHSGVAVQHGQPKNLVLLAESHRTLPHRCCRDYCQPVSTGGEESCTCELETSTLAILSPPRADVSPPVVPVAWLEVCFDLSRSKLPRVCTRPGESLAYVRSPGRVQSVLFDRWLI